MKKLFCFADVNPISGDVCGDLKVEEQTSFLLCVYDASPTDKTKPPYIGIFVSICYLKQNWHALEHYLLFWVPNLY